VGDYLDSTDTAHGFLYSGGSYTTIDPPGRTGISIAGINDIGQIVGSYNDPSGQHGFIATPNSAPPPTVVADTTSATIGTSINANAAHGVLANDTGGSADEQHARGPLRQER
jgi:hypothetical protein